jgi:hypothetical protein
MIEKARRSNKEVTFQYRSPYVDKEFLTSYIVRGDRLISAQMDITERKRAEQECETTTEFLQLVKKSKGTVDLVHSAINFIRGRSGFEAVGIRLKDGNDYPYFETCGFPAKFVKLENNLCVKDAAGQLICDSSGYPIRECMCGNVIFEGSIHRSYSSRHVEVSVPIAPQNCWPPRLMPTDRLARATDVMAKGTNPWLR